ncbi:hypothetical protein CQW23_23540 [Capsicum baccatum]|uniref:Ubiquitin-like protease family profile domain-containing protein n=1 Tax=Capsicum baccatum TaxID=33114 RepID=A0A2G2VS84_CAPBA|nr:hypothetical protein CQW23_23540 [Capsicum baccatum]
MNYVGVETSPQQFSPTVDQNLNENQENKDNVGSISKPDIHREIDLGTEEQIMKTPKIQELTTGEQQDKTVWPDSQDTIPDDLLPSLNLRIRRPSKFNESPYTMQFGSAAESSEGHIRIFPQKHPFVYHPIDGIVDTKIVNKFIDWISEDLLKVHAKRSYKFSTVDCNFMNISRFVHDVYSVDAANLTAGGQVAHLNEYINGFHNCIFLYDSYESSSHYSAVLDVIEKLVAISPLCLQYCDFYIKKEIDVENHLRYKDKDSSDMFDVLFQESLPQQPSGSLDCGVYVVTYAECLSYGHKVLANEFDPNALRKKYATLL